MQISALAQRLLPCIFSLSSGHGPLTRPKLARRSGLAPRVLNRVLHELDQLGLVDAQRLRLTLSGLALAVACGARVSTPRRRSASGQGRPLGTSRTQAPLFATRELPRAVA